MSCARAGERSLSTPGEEGRERGELQATSRMESAIDREINRYRYIGYPILDRPISYYRIINLEI